MVACFAPNCNSGYTSCSKKVSLFSAPKNPELFERWKKLIPRSDKQLGRSDYICANHFLPKYIKNDWKIKIGNHVEVLNRGRPSLTVDAVPTIFKDFKALQTKSRKKMKSDKQKTVQKVVENDPMFANHLWDCIGEVSLPNASWCVNKIDFENKRTVMFLEFIMLPGDVPTTRKQMWLNLNDSMHPRFSVYGCDVYKSDDLKSIPITEVFTLEDVQNVLRWWNQMSVCVGGPKTSEFVLLENAIRDVRQRVWRHVNCSIVVDGKERCIKCCELKEMLNDIVIIPK